MRVQASQPDLSLSKLSCFRLQFILLLFQGLLGVFFTLHSAVLIEDVPLDHEDFQTAR